MCIPTPPLESEGLQIEVVTPTHIRVTLAPSRGLVHVPNMLQLRVKDRPDHPLRIDVTFPDPEARGQFDEYPHSATPDFSTFIPLEWEKPANGGDNTLHVPPTGWPQFYIGMQCPLPLPALEKRLHAWADHPHAQLQVLGHSIEGRPIHQLVIHDPASTPAWEHLIVNQHPGEGNARWRMVGMIDALLADTPVARRLRQTARIECIPLLCPDGPANGWRRVNADGIDMNRCHRMEGPDASLQTREAYLFQQRLESRPPHTLWCMHTWPGLTHPILDGEGPEFNTRVGSVADLTACFAAHGEDLIKPLQVRGEPGGATTWNGGPRRRLGITTFLIEGGGEPATLQPHLEAGRRLLNILDEFWKAPLK